MMVEELFFYCVVNIVSKGDNLMTNMNKKPFAKKMKRKKLKDTRKSRPPLWSVPVPKHNLPSIGGKVRLYHYTPI